MPKTFNKLILRKITTNKSRYLSILIIVILGVAFYSGVRATSPNMKITANDYFTKQNFMDLELISPTGFSEREIDEIKQLKGIKQVDATYSTEVFVPLEHTNLAIKLMSIKEQQINQPILIEGQLPTKDDECVVDAKFLRQSNFQLGDLVTLTSEQFPIEHILEYSTYKIVGVVNHPQYISIERGASTISSDSIDSFIMIREESFNLPDYTHVYITLENNNNHSRFSQDYEHLINDAKASIEALNSNWYILDIYTNPGFMGYKNDTQRIDAIGKVFPLVFFLVASLVTLTSMTRMVDQDRTEIGTLKSLGYSRQSILKEYLLYAISASLIGSIIGNLLGFHLFPRLIYNAYGILYDLPKMKVYYVYTYAYQSTLFAVLLVTIPAYIVCLEAFKSHPAILLRPKAPVPGKRIFLERISLIWKRLKFIQKLTARNIFRYKKRFFMTVLGIAGCTALLLTGYGLRDSIGELVHKQFNEIRHYDLEVTLKEHLRDEDYLQFDNSLKQTKSITDYTYIKQHSIEIKNNPTSNIYLIVPINEEINQFITFRTRVNKQDVYLKPQGVIITEKLSHLLKIKENQPITLITHNKEEITVIVLGIVENYVNHYIYMDQVLYEQLYHTSYQPNKVLANTQGNEETILNDLENINQIRSISFISSIIKYFDDMILALNFVVIVLIVSAALLAFVVLFSLNNINIDERKRELATIKVLGFYDSEVSMYIYRENIILTLIGSLVGLILGVFLHRFVIITAETDMVMFTRDIKTQSYIYSILLTFIFASIVNVLMFIRLKRINMIESLKNVE